MILFATVVYTSFFLTDTESDQYPALWCQHMPPSRKINKLPNFSQMTHFRQQALVAGQPTGVWLGELPSCGQLPVKPQTINAYDRLFI